MMKSKFKTNKRTNQNPIAGILKGDSNIEFFGIRSSKEVKFLQNGRTYDFEKLPDDAAYAVINAYEQDRGAKAYFKTLKDDQGQPLKYARRVELYIYYCYGALTPQPDMVDDILQGPHNFRHTKEYVRSHFDERKLHINGQVLKPREITMIDHFAKDYTDPVIAEMMGIALPTLNDHKRTLFDKAGVQTKTALMIQAERNQLTVY